MTDTERAEYNDVVRKLTMKLEEAVGEVDRLRNVVAKLTGTDDAHSTLRRLYLDETQSSSVRVRAATAAIGHESAPLKSVSQLELKAEEPVIPLAEVVRLQRARAKALEGLRPDDPKYREWVWNDNESMSEQVARLTGGNGDGQDGNSGTGGDSSDGDRS
jgi:hypothetical protein